MSRVARSPVAIPTGVEIKQTGQALSVKDGKGNLNLNVHPLVEVSVDVQSLTVAPNSESKAGWA